MYGLAVDRMEVKESDWKLFRKMVQVWQERLCDRFVQKYSDLLGGNEPSGEKFWKLEKMIRKDSTAPGMIIDMRRSQMLLNLVALMRAGVIREDELESFSGELREAVMHLTGR